MVYHFNRHFDRSKPNYSEHLLILTRMLPVLLSIGKPTRLSNLSRKRHDEEWKWKDVYLSRLLPSKQKIQARLISFAPLENVSRLSHVILYQITTGIMLRFVIATKNKCSHVIVGNRRRESRRDSFVKLCYTFVPKWLN